MRRPATIRDPRRRELAEHFAHFPLAENGAVDHFLVRDAVADRLAHADVVEGLDDRRERQILERVRHRR